MALDKNKTDYNLGLSIKAVLEDAGVETPMKVVEPSSSEDKFSSIKKSVQDIMSTLGLDITDDSLSETPKRIAKMYLNEIFWGLNYENFPKITVIENKMQYSTMLLERHIKVNSTCEHHFVPIMGEAFIAYIPDKKIIGLSKLNRVVEFFCRRPQVQERLVEQIYHALVYLLDTESVAVVIKAEHLCVKSRGVEDVNSDTITSRLGGEFMEDSALRNEFYQSLRL